MEALEGSFNLVCEDIYHKS